MNLLNEKGLGNSLEFSLRVPAIYNTIDILLNIEQLHSFDYLILTFTLFFELNFNNVKNY